MRGLLLTLCILNLTSVFSKEVVINIPDEDNNSVAIKEIILENGTILTPSVYIKEIQQTSNEKKLFFQNQPTMRPGETGGGW